MVLVTGGTGLVGSHLLYQLSLSNETVLAIHRKSSDLQAVKRVFSYYTTNAEALFNKIHWKIADINDIVALTDVFNANITEIYHCAAMISFNPKDYRSMRKINIEGTANMINFSIESNVKKFCFVSSIAAIGKSLNNNLITEKNEWNTEDRNHGYAISKFGGESEVWRGSQEGLATIIVNPGVILGPGFWKNGSGKLFNTVNNGFRFFTEGITGFVGVEDVVKSMLLLMKSDIKNERFILISENVSFKNILHQIAEGLSAKKASIKTSFLLSEVTWRLDWLKSTITGVQPLLTKQAARAGHNKSYYSSEKLKKALGFNFESITNVIKKISSFYKQDQL